MPESILPSAEEALPLIPTPATITWRRSADARVMLTAGYALMLQVAHPTVGAGVAEHSDFQRDPWGRLFRTLDYTSTMVYGGAAAAIDMGARVRAMHKRIKGTLPNGEHYHALEPEAYAWVHATLAESIVLGHQRFGRPLRPDQVERFWVEWRGLGRLLGIRSRDLPEDWAGFRTYFDEIVATRLESTQSVHDVLAALARPSSPPVPSFADPAWKAMRVPTARIFHLATVGLMPPILRARCGLHWTPREERELRALGRASRAATPLMPERLRIFGPSYLRWRADALARGEVASPTRGPQVRIAA